MGLLAISLTVLAALHQTLTHSTPLSPRNSSFNVHRCTLEKLASHTDMHTNAGSAFYNCVTMNFSWQGKLKLIDICAKR